jgi:hypothetical protein
MEAPVPEAAYTATITRGRWQLNASTDFSLPLKQRPPRPHVTTLLLADSIHLLTDALLPSQAMAESANFVSLRFCVLDNNIMDIECVLSCADSTDKEMPGRIIRPGVAG